MVLTWVLLSLFIYVTSYNLRCPATSEWRLAGKAMCNITDEYFCLYDNIEYHYVQGCKNPDWDRKGSKRIVARDFTRATCKEDRYQPFIFWTNGSSDCVYQKSLCNEEGQVIYSNGSSKEDRFCSCDFTSGYAFVVTPSNLCYCDLSALEDCSCYLKTCKEGYTLSADYECVGNTSKPTNCPGSITKNPKDEPDRPILPNSSYGNRTEEVLDLDLYRQNELYALYCIAIVLFLIIVFTILTLRFRQLINRYVSQCNNQIVQPLQKCLSNVFMRSFCCRKKENYDVPDNGFTSKPPNIQSNEKGSLELRGLFKTEEVYTLQIVHLVFRVAYPILRIKFDKRVPPDQLKGLLNKCSRELQEKFKRKEISPTEKKTLFPLSKGLPTSDLFDIKIMVIVLKTLLEKNLIKTFNDEADWYLIEKYQQYISTDSMVFTVQTFQESWDEISEAILRLVADELPYISNNPEYTQLRDRISSLNLVPFGSKQLHKFITLYDQCSAMILQQIIKEYCENRNVTFQNLLKEEKHSLFHRRKSTKSCCTCDESSCRQFVKSILDRHWQQLFDTTGINCSNKCGGKKEKCEKKFTNKTTLKLDACDTSLATCLILNLQDLSRYTFKQMCVNGFSNFLNHHKHRLYHAMEKDKCCKCIQEPNLVTFLDKREWEKLFSQFHNCCTYRCCDKSDCCCKYTARSRASRINDYDLLSNIMKYVGPISSIKEQRQEVFNSFINRSFDDEYLEQKLDLRPLLNMTSNAPFKTTIEKKIMTSKTEEDDSKVNAELHAWASSCLSDMADQSNTSTSLLPILIKEEGGLKVYKVSSRKEFSFPRQRELKVVSQEELNFLQIFQLIFKVACPAVRTKFDQVFPPKYMKHILYDWAREFRGNDQSRRHNKDRLFLNDQQWDMLNSKSSKDFDLDFMGYLLKKKIPEEKRVLQELLDRCHQILHSCDGILSYAKFEKYWEDISEKSAKIGGDKFRKVSLELKHETT